MTWRLALPLIAILLAPLAAAQTAPVLIERADAADLTADVGEPTTATYRLLNLNRVDEFYVSVAVDAPRTWSADADPASVSLGPRNETLVRVVVEPSSVAREVTVEVKLTFSILNTQSGQVATLERTFEVGSSAPPRVLGVLPNPLGPPFDNAYGTFLIDMGFWIAIGVASVFAGNTIVRMATARASNTTTHQIIQKLRRPIFLFVLFLGLAQSFSILPRALPIILIEKILVAVAVTVFGLYVLYRLLDAGLTYYQREIAKRTQTKVDDILVPVFRKVGLVVIYAVGIILTLQRLGWDPTFVFAGAGIAGLVIAFAAQDTFSNLFSGVFLMVDRPFKEGDDIRLENGDVARVEAIGLRTTRLYIGRAHEVVVLPNNALASTRVVNLTGPDKRYWIMIDIGVAYGSDPEKVKRVLTDVALAHPRVTRDAGWEPLVIFGKFGESSLDFVLRCGVEDYTQRFLVASEIRFAIVAAFEREGIEIPFPQRVLHLRPEEGADARRLVNQNP